jgi:hypothetical protein
MPIADVVAIQQLMALYGHAADGPTGEMLSRVFTENAIYESGARGRRFVGLAAIEAWFGEGKPPHPPAHQTTNSFVYRDGSHVRVRSKYVAVNQATGTLRMGDYDDIVVSTPQGWRIQHRVSSERHGDSRQHGES